MALKKYLKSRMPQDQVKAEIEEEDPITVATRNLCRGDSDGMLRLGEEAFRNDFRVEERYLDKIRGLSCKSQSVAVTNLSCLCNRLIEMKSLESLDFSGMLAMNPTRVSLNRYRRMLFKNSDTNNRYTIRV